MIQASVGQQTSGSRFLLHVCTYILHNHDIKSDQRYYKNERTRAADWDCCHLFFRKSFVFFLRFLSLLFIGQEVSSLLLYCLNSSSCLVLSCLLSWVGLGLHSIPFHSYKYKYTSRHVIVKHADKSVQLHITYKSLHSPPALVFALSIASSIELTYCIV